MPQSGRNHSRRRASRNVEFDDDETTPSLESYDADPLRRFVAAALLDAGLRAPSEEEAQRLQKVASDVFHCGTPRDLLWGDPSRSHIVFQSCRRPALCSRCSTSKAFECAQKDAARVGRVLSRFPHLRCLQARVALGETSDLREGVDRLFAYVRMLAEARTSAWDRVGAGIVQVHPQRGRGGAWRPHLHMILLVNPTGRGSIDREFARALRLKRLRRSDDGWTGQAAEAEWFVRNFRGENASRSEALRRIGAAPEAQAYRISKYDADHVLDDVDDRVRVFLALESVQLRRMWGLVRAIPGSELQESWDKIERENPDLAKRTKRLFSSCMENNPPRQPRPRLRVGPAIVEAKQRRTKRYEMIAQELREGDSRKRSRASASKPKRKG